MSGAFIYGPDYLRAQEDKQLHSIADTLEALMKDNAKLKSFDHFKSMVTVMSNFNELDENGKKAIELMMDGLKYRGQNKLNLEYKR